MKIKTIFIGRRPARENPRNQGGGRAKRVRCQELIAAGAKEMKRALKFGGLGHTAERAGLREITFNKIADLASPILMKRAPWENDTKSKVRVHACRRPRRSDQVF